MPPWSAIKTKVQLRISIQRLRILQEKKEAQAKAARREIATLLEGRKLEKARVKVENIIHEDIHIELLELLELYCELLLARFGLLEQNTREPDPGISEGVCNIIFAAPRTEVRELQVLRDQLMQKYGREFSLGVMENRDGCVSDRVVNKTNIGTPSAQLVDAYLAEIARGYGIEWDPPSPTKDNTKQDSSNNDSENGDDKVPANFSKPERLSHHEVVGDVEKAALGALGIDKSFRISGSSVPTLPDLPPTEGDSPGNKGGGLSVKKKDEGGDKVPQVGAGEDDQFTLLTKRFEALKRR